MAIARVQPTTLTRPQPTRGNAGAVCESIESRPPTAVTRSPSSPLVTSASPSGPAGSSITSPQRSASLSTRLPDSVSHEMGFTRMGEAHPRPRSGSEALTLSATQHGASMPGMGGDTAAVQRSTRSASANDVPASGFGAGSKPQAPGLRLDSLRGGVLASLRMGSRLQVSTLASEGLRFADHSNGVKLAPSQHMDQASGPAPRGSASGASASAAALPLPLMVATPLGPSFSGATRSTTSHTNTVLGDTPSGSRGVPSSTTLNPGYACLQQATPRRGSQGMVEADLRGPWLSASNLADDQSKVRDA